MPDKNDSAIEITLVQKFKIVRAADLNGLVLTIEVKDGDQPVNYLIGNEKIALLAGLLLAAGQDCSAEIPLATAVENRQISDRQGFGVAPVLKGLYLRDKDLVLDLGFATLNFSLADNDLWLFFRDALIDKGRFAQPQ